MKKILVKTFPLLALFLIAAFSSCEKKDDYDTNKNREVYFGNNILGIVFPETRDTINFTDSITGFSMVLKNQMLDMKYDVEDIITFRGEKKNMRIVLKYKDFKISEEKEGMRTFTFKGDAKLYLSPAYIKDPVDTISLDFVPATGYIKGNAMYYQHSEIPTGTNPYVMARYKGERIYF